MNDRELCHELIARADEARHDRPREALELARAGRTLAASLAREHRDWLALQAEAWAVLGSALRGVGALDDAETALNAALSFLEADTSSGMARGTRHARLARRAAYLRASQGRHDEAFELVDEALDAFDRLGDRRAWASCLVDRAALLATGGHTREALSLLRRTLEEHGSVLEPRAFLAAVHNVALYLHLLPEVCQGDDELLHWIDLAIRCHRRVPETLGRLKLEALRGQVAVRTGDIAGGVHVLRHAADGFTRHGATVLQAMTLIDLAAAHIEVGEHAAARRIAGELFPLIARLRDRPRAMRQVLDAARTMQTGTARAATLIGAARALEARAAGHDAR